MDSNLNESDLPLGTVTFLFTDIQGSTRLLQTLGDQYAQVLADQRRIVRDCLKKWEGREHDTEGDSFFASFGKTSRAINAVVEIQKTIASHPWPEGSQVRLRVGLHSGEPAVAEEGYIGLDIHRAARIASIGHGGQVLLSEATAALIQDRLPDGVLLRELGDYQLKDFERPEKLTQLLIPGLPQEFPPLKLMDIRSGNLPTPTTPFIGRKAELDELCKLIADPDVRLVTILGAGGMGKTRLALAAAHRIQNDIIRAQENEVPDVSDGIYFVDLAPLESWKLLETVIAKSLDFNFFQGGEPRKQLLDYLRQKRLLLILDNFEHLLDGVDLVSEIIQGTERVEVLVTSRERLHLSSELLFPLHGMAFPDVGLDLDHKLFELEQQYSAIHLFTRSAQRANPRLVFIPEDIQASAEICRLVEGMPLGIELAAAWADTLSLKEIAGEIQKHLDFLSAERRDLPERHQSIRAVFDSSWAYLEEDEQRNFTALAVFRGGFTADGAQNVVGMSLNGLKKLVSKSLILCGPGGRFTIHELLRQYAMEKLSRDPEAEARLRERHCEYCATFVSERIDAIHKADFRDLVPEKSNIRSGLRWGALNAGYIEIRKQLLGLWQFFEGSGWRHEAEELFEWLVEASATEQPEGDQGGVYGYAKAILGWFHFMNGQVQAGNRLWFEAEQILRQLEPQDELAWTLATRARFGEGLSYRDSVEYFTECLDYYCREDDQWGVAFTHNCWGDKAILSNQYEDAEEHYQAALKSSIERDNRNDRAWFHSGLGYIAVGRGELDKARMHLEQALCDFEETDNKQWAIERLRDLGLLASLAGNYHEAETYYRRAIERLEKLGDRLGTAETTVNLGSVALASGDYDLADKCFDEASSSINRLGVLEAKPWLLGCKGDLWLARGDLHQARKQYRAALEMALGYRRTSSTLVRILEVVSLFSHIGKVERAIELASLDYSHHEIGPFVKYMVKQTLEELQGKLPPEEFDDAKRRGEQLELWSTVEALIEELDNLEQL
jgi:predicted ATPase/class 3 adenylate cyclase/tetratricopeptide (TPR) repeat protein